MSWTSTSSPLAVHDRSSSRIRSVAKRSSASRMNVNSSSRLGSSSRSAATSGRRRPATGTGRDPARSQARLADIAGIVARMRSRPARSPLDAPGRRTSSSAVHDRRLVVLPAPRWPLVLASRLRRTRPRPVDAGPFTRQGGRRRRRSTSPTTPSRSRSPTGVPLRPGARQPRQRACPTTSRSSQGDQSLGQSPVVTGPATTEVRFGPLRAGQLPVHVHGPPDHDRDPDRRRPSRPRRPQPPAGPPPSPGSVIEAGSSSSSSRSGRDPALERELADRAAALAGASLASAAAAS